MYARCFLSPAGPHYVTHCLSQFDANDVGHPVPFHSLHPISKKKQREDKLTTCLYVCRFTCLIAVENMSYVCARAHMAAARCSIYMVHTCIDYSSKKRAEWRERETEETAEEEGGDFNFISPVI